MSNPIVEIILSHGENNDATDFPYWGICVNEMFDGGDGPSATCRVILVQGIWFSRDAAERHRIARIYEYGDESFVYCFSGYHSTHLRQIYEAARMELTEASA